VHVDCVTDRLSLAYGVDPSRNTAVTNLKCKRIVLHLADGLNFLLLNSFSLLINTVADIQIFVLSKHVEL
jgi:hypothetical protein